MKFAENGLNLSNAAVAVARAHAEHAENTCTTERLIVRFADALELRNTHARFAAHFLRALELRAACSAAGISYETGRAYLKKLFEVTGTVSQVQLVVILGKIAN